MSRSTPQDQSADATPHTTTKVSRVERLATGSVRYSRLNGFRVPNIDFDRVVVCESRARLIAAAYMAAPITEPAALPAYCAFSKETGRQFDYLTSPRRRGGLGLAVEVSVQDPYENATAMMHDIRDNNQLKVHATSGSESGHPVLSDDENDMFRAVHDAFGHASIGRGFDRHREEAAWLNVLPAGP